MKIGSTAMLTTAAALSLGAAPAFADPVVISAQGSDVNGYTVAPGPNSYKTEVSVTSGPTLTAKLTAFAQPVTGTGAIAYLEATQAYSFSINNAQGVSGLSYANNGYGLLGGSIQQGTAADFSIPLLFTFSGFTSTIGDAYVSADVSVYNANGQTGGGSGFCDFGYSCGTFGEVNQAVPFVFLHYTGGDLNDPSSFVYAPGGKIELHARMNAEAIYDSHDAVALARVDPTLTIDPTYLATHPGASLSFQSVPLLGGGTVPEPATWAMLIMGFGLIGTALRASKRRRGRGPGLVLQPAR